MSDKRKVVSRDRSTNAVLDTKVTTFSPAASWTHRPDAQAVREHDFSNLLQDLRYAVEQQDRSMIDYCECELKLMYRHGPLKAQRLERNPSSFRDRGIDSLSLVQLVRIRKQSAPAPMSNGWPEPSDMEHPRKTG
jgi:hypothetical protein